MIRVLALVPYPERRAPGQRYRIEQWAPVMRAEGVEVTVAPFLDDRGMDVLYAHGRVAAKVAAMFRGQRRRTNDMRALSDFDVVYVYREATLGRSAWAERMAARRLPLVYDFDDAIYLRAASTANAAFAFLKDARKAERLCTLAAHVTVANEHLAEFARRHARTVTVVPSTIDTDAYTVKPRAEHARVVIGWTGSRTTAPYLQALLPALRRLRGRMDFELRVIGADVQDPALDVRCVPWSAPSEVEDLRAIDIGLMPLPDDEWARGKGGMKALQYMALGIPPVVSPVGVNTTIVTHGVNGLHAASDDEWVERLERLGRDTASRAQLGAEARRTVVEGYSAAVHAPRMARIFQDVVAARRPPA
jgi:glycosyltransferase involved in cell wall biosynthesis